MEVLFITWNLLKLTLLFWTLFLIVTSKTRNNGIGKALMETLEKYFKDNNCEYVLVDVFAYNKNGIKFYDKQGYHPRMYTEIKKI